jgi:uncharacterized membrane protein
MYLLFATQLKQLFFSLKHNAMNAVIGIGRYLLLLFLLGFGVKHLMDGPELAGLVPLFFPGGIVWIYLTGIAMLMAVVSGFIGKWDKLAFTLAGLMILVFALTIHLRGLLEGGNPRVLFDLLKDIGLAGACWMYASCYARDSSFIR